MTPETGQRLFIDKQDLHHLQFQADPDAPTARRLAEGEARLTIEHFALTANNITYAAFGEAMKYWQFFPAPDPSWGCLPVWGFATVSESRADGVAVGRRVWGYWPAGTHLVLQPGRVNDHSFVDEAPHRKDLAGAYQRYVFCDTDPSWAREREGLQAVLQPLFVTSFLIDDFLTEAQYFGAQQLLFSSASSKTAYGTAFCLAQRRGTPGQPRVLGLSSAANIDFSRSLGCYDALALYDEIEQLDPSVPTVYVDYAGNADLRRRVHQHFGASLAYSCSIGGSHWNAIGSGAGLPGPRPTLFFAPAQIKKRSAPPPEGWGAEVLNKRLGQAMGAFVQRVARADDPWVRIVEAQGAAATETAYRSLLAGTVSARDGLMLGLQAQA